MTFDSMNECEYKEILRNLPNKSEDLAHSFAETYDLSYPSEVNLLCVINGMLEDGMKIEDIKCHIDDILDFISRFEIKE